MSTPATQDRHSLQQRMVSSSGFIDGLQAAEERVVPPPRIQDHLKDAFLHPIAVVFQNIRYAC